MTINYDLLIKTGYVLMTVISVKIESYQSVKRRANLVIKNTKILTSSLAPFRFLSHSLLRPRQYYKPSIPNHRLPKMIEILSHSSSSVNNR